ncbi:MAG: hypothetical protein ACLR56_00595 [Oscillospiraceae bacterium]
MICIGRGEQMFIALLAMAIEARLPVISVRLAGGLCNRFKPLNRANQKVNAERIRNEISNAI